MCGRVVQARPLEELAELYAAPPDDIARGALRPRYNVAPTDPIAVVVTEDGERHLTAHRWGLIPPAPRSASESAPLINTRVETLATNALFSAAFRHRRCLVPVDGFYEWQRTGEGRQPYFIHAADGHPLALAGIWLPWRSGPTGLVGSCSIVTSPPDEVVGRLHDRMPVILPEASWDRWLDPETATEDAQALLRSDAAATLDAYPVVRLVNSVRNDGPELLAPADVQATLFA